MKMNEYVVAKTLEEAYTLLKENDSNMVVGGGAWIKMSSNKEINTLIDLKDLTLNTITSNKDAFFIGANVTLHELELNEEIGQFYDGIVIQAIKEIMGMGIRNLATVGGSVMGRFSFSDLFAVLIALDAKLEFYHHKEVSVRDFLDDKKFDKDILLQVVIPKKEAKGYFKKVKRTALDFAILNIAIVKGGEFEIVIGARPGIAKRAEKTCAFLQDKDITEEVLEEAVSILEEEMSFSNNVRGSKEYRLDLAKVYVKRGIKEVIK